IKHAGEQVSILVKEEIKLARLELSNKSQRAGRGAGLLGGALLIALYAIGTLIAAAVLGVAVVFEPWLAALIVGGGLLLLALSLALVGKSQLKAATPAAPSETLESVRADMDALKGKD
ncbi:MAG: phage holin family protein, partial [Mycobacteriales bacterium]